MVYPNHFHSCVFFRRKNFYIFINELKFQATELFIHVFRLT